jgi:hypothetical protein
MSSISVVLSPLPQPHTHVLPINATATLHNALYTAGRDGTVVQHEQRHLQADPLLERRHIQLHSDWINDIALLDNNDNSTDNSTVIVVSASSDLTVKYWNPSSHAHGIIGHHGDYVKGVTTLGTTVYSAGLDSVVRAWDINRCTELNKWANNNNNNNKPEKSSLYAIRACQERSMLAVGDLQGNLNLVDSRTLELISRVDAHSDVIKTMIVGDQYLLSGSSDSTVKLHDLRNLQEPVRTYQFDESIWCLKAAAGDNDNDKSFTEFYSGGSTGNVYHTVVDSGITTHVHSEQKGILSIASFNDDIFVSSMTGSNLTNITNAQASIKGQPGLIRSQMLNNRRHVVSLSTCDEVMMWDILSLKMIKSFGRNVEFETIISQFQTSEILNSWCRVIVKSGRLFVVVNDINWNDCEVYGNFLNDYQLSAKLEHDVRYSLGKLFLLSLFQKFVQYELKRDKLMRDARIADIKNSGSSKLSNILTSKFSDGSAAAASSSSSKPTTPIDDTDSSDRKFKFFSRKSKQNVIPVAVEQQQQQHQQQQHPPPDYSNTTFQIILDLKAQYAHIQSLSTLSSISLISLPSDPYLTSFNPLTALEKEQIQLIISKDVDGSSSGQIDTYSENFNKLFPSSNNDIATDEDFECLEKKLPTWIGNFLLKNKFYVKETPKIGFVITKDPTDDTVPDLKKNVVVAPANTPPPSAPSSQPAPSSGSSQQQPPSQAQTQGHTPSAAVPVSNGRTTSNASSNNPAAATNDQQQQQRSGSTTSVVSIPESELRLNAYGMLRMRKVLQYLYEKFNIDEFKAMPANEGLDLEYERIEDWLELVCLDTVLDNDLTLTTLRSFVWKRAGDAKLVYRRKR